MPDDVMKVTVDNNRPSPDSAFNAAALVYALTPLFWLPQAALLAWAVARLHEGDGFSAVTWPAIGVFVLGLVRTLCENLAATRLHDQARAYLSRWRRYATRVLATRSPLDRHRVPAGAAASILSDQAGALLPWLTRYRGAALRVRLVPLFILLPVLWLSWVSALVLVVAAPLIPLFMAIVGWRAKEASQKQWVQLSDMNAFLLDRLRGLPTLRSLGAIEWTASRVRSSAETLRRRTMAVLRIAFLSSAVLELFSALGVAMVAVYIGFHLLGHLGFGSWGSQLSLSEGLFILLLAPSFFEPLRELAAAWHDRAAGEAAMEALESIATGGLMLPEADSAAASLDARAVTGVSVPRLRADQFVHKPGLSFVDRAAEPAVGPGIQVRQLGFAFPDSAPLFQDICFDVAPGEKVALLGKSGSGKTVLLSLLAGLLALQSGEIGVDGVRLTPESIPSLRSRMAWMGQNAHVFAGSVEDNIALRRSDSARAHVLDAIHCAHLDTVAQAHPGVLLGEGGIGLSGGEIARLALARLAFATEADVLLLDEPTAHLDSETARLVRQALVTIMGQRTVIVATHDPLLAGLMDRVIDVDQLFARETDA